jgi:hypothetical protein
MAAVQVNLGEILDEVKSLTRQHAGMLATLVGVITAGYSALDLLGANSASVAVNLVVSVLVQYAVLERLLADRMTEAAIERGRSYGSLFGSAFISGAAILVGLIVLVLPGVYLAGRWLSSGPQVVAGGQTATGALRASWDASDASQLTHCLVVVLMAVPFLIMMVSIGVGFADSDPEFVSFPAVLILNLAVAGVTAFGWLAAAAAYRVTTPAANGLGEVFS